LKALELGAVDFILKYTPDAPVSRASLRREIIAKVKAAAAAHPTRRPAPTAPVAGVQPHLPARAVSRAAAPSDAAGVVLSGPPTAAPSAICELIRQLAADLPAPCVIVQHLPATFTALSAAQLKRHAKVPVRVAQEGDRLEPGLVLVAPGAMHLLIK